jgi:hypothetical protein
VAPNAEGAASCGKIVAPNSVTATEARTRQSIAQTAEFLWALLGRILMPPVKREEFQFKSDVELVHRPTGASISTYRYQNPADACSSMTVNFGTDSEYDRMDILRVAYELLREKALASG